MKPGIALTYAVVLFCVIESVCSGINEFFAQVSNEVGGAFHTAWTKISTVVNKPVRVRKVSRIHRRKHTTTTMTTGLPSGTETSTINVFLTSGVATPVQVKPTIPVFPTPTYKSIVAWRKQQIPFLLNSIMKDNPSEEETEILENIEETTMPSNYKLLAQNRSLLFV